jgi:hypothetical protein
LVAICCVVYSILQAVVAGLMQWITRRPSLQGENILMARSSINYAGIPAQQTAGCPPCWPVPVKSNFDQLLASAGANLGDIQTCSACEQSVVCPGPLFTSTLGYQGAGKAE